MPGVAAISSIENGEPIRIPMSARIIAAVVLVLFTHQPGFAEAGLSKRRAAMKREEVYAMRAARDMTSHRAGPLEPAMPQGSKRQAAMITKREEANRAARAQQLPEPWMPGPAVPQQRKAAPGPHKNHFRVSARLPDTHRCLSRVVGKLPEYKVVQANAKCSGGRGTGSVFMAVLQKKDIVSYSIDTFKSWETEETQRMEEALAAGAKARGAENGTLLDIGANIGWYTVHMAQCGHDVVAVEPSQFNANLIRLSICLNNLEHKATVINYALGPKEQTCALMSVAHNRGDCFTVCSMDVFTKWISSGEEWVTMGLLKMRKLDDLLGEFAPSRTYDALKIDVEGFEVAALKSGLSLLSDPIHAPLVIFSEFAPVLISTAGYNPVEYIEMLRGLGYKICLQDGHSNPANMGPHEPQKGQELPSGEALEEQMDHMKIRRPNQPYHGAFWDILAVKPSPTYSYQPPVGC